MLRLTLGHDIKCKFLLNCLLHFELWFYCTLNSIVLLYVSCVECSIDDLTFIFPCF
jgi:hypothetical protein